MPEPNLPSVPAAQNVQISPFSMPFQPLGAGDFLNLNSQMFSQQMGNALKMMQAIPGAMQQYGIPLIQQSMDVEREFMPQQAELYGELLQQANPQFMPLYNELGGQLMGNLQLGMEMGPELTREVEQGIRAAQTARGNWLGGAPTAQEAFGRGSAALGLYNQRLGQAQNFLNSKQPTDMWSQLQLASQSDLYNPMALMAVGTAAQQVNPQIAPNVFGTMQEGISSYNATSANAYGSYVSGLVGAANVNNQSAFDRYSAQFDQFLYGQSVQQGLYSAPQGGGGGMGGFGTAAIGAVGAAAAGAAAAICWVARKVMPDRWREFRRWLFTKAPCDFRQKYVTYGRRFAESLSNECDIERIRKAMERCLQS